MKIECTELFVRYREMARLLWNVGFWPNPKLRQWDASELCAEAAARLFEGVVLLALGYQGRIANKNRPGEIDDFEVRVKELSVELRIDEYLPADGIHVWGRKVIDLSDEPAAYKFRFVRFFDWEDLGPRDLSLLEVEIQRFDDHPQFEGHHALIEFRACSLWFEQ